MDIRPAETARVGGTATYTRQLARHLLATEGRHHLVLLATQRPNALDDLRAHPGVTWLPTRSNAKTWRTQRELPGLLAAAGVDIFHSPGSFLPLAGWGGRSVLMVHDLQLGAALRGGGAAASARAADSALNLVPALLRADVLLTSTEFVASRLRRLGWLSRRVRVVPLAPDPRTEVEPHPDDVAEVGRLTGGSPYVLCAGELSPRKELVILLEAFAAAGTWRQARLVLAGPVRGRFSAHLRAIAGELAIGDAVVLPGTVNPGLLAALYRGATCAVMPSRHEGFGLPALEAMGCGVPVIAADTEAVAEVTGDAARRFMPGSVAELARALTDVVADGDLRARLVSDGLVNRARFSWERTARLTLDVYDELAASS